MAQGSLFRLTVPVSTIRDFVYTDDVAARIVRWAIEVAPTSSRVEVKLMVAGRSVTLGHVIAMTRAISRSRARVLLASDPAASAQPGALRFRSRVLPELDAACPARPLEEGIQRTWEATMGAIRSP